MPTTVTQTDYNEVRTLYLVEEKSVMKTDHHKYTVYVTGKITPRILIIKHKTHYF